MVYNNFIKCRVCNSITRIRLQVGFLKKHPLVIICGKCGVSLLGKVCIDNIKPALKFEFDNADIFNGDEKYDYTVECSGEFPTLKHNAEDQFSVGIITPFIRNVSRMSDDGYSRFRKSLNGLFLTASRWNDFKRIIDLSKNGNREYLLQEIRRVFPEYLFPCRNEFEIMRTIHLIEVNGFLTPLRSDLLDDLSFSGDILKLDFKELTKLIDFLNSHDGFNLLELQDSIYKILESFIENFQMLIPAFCIQFYNEYSIDYEIEGSSTSDYDSIKQFYLDAYEVLGNLMILPIALNNIMYRGSFSSVESINDKIKDLDNFIAARKGLRFHSNKTSEVYIEKLNLQVDTQLRNAIGHNDVEYYPLTQKITYIPDPKNRSKKMTKYLLEFETEAIHMIQAIIVIDEYLYRLREIDLMNKGHIPINSFNTMGKSVKVGRNDLCPCGSGKKYKKCCLGK